MLPQNEYQTREEIGAGLTGVYADIDSQLEVAGIIRDHLTKKSDIREAALKRLDLSSARRIVDLGCGTGYFTQALEGKVHPDATVTGIEVHEGYRAHFLKTCNDTGLKGIFDGRGIAAINTLPMRSFDLALCSYSLYFFPGYIARIAGLLKPAGRFVTITHAMPHIPELTTVVREVLTEGGIRSHQELPYESLMMNFNGQNGAGLLTAGFRKVRKYVCKGVMEFTTGGSEDLVRYLRHKEAFLLPGNGFDRERTLQDVIGRIMREMERTGIYRIAKDDCIFVCSEPEYQETD